MTRPRVVRLLRISMSAVCVVASVLLIALWVRSYSKFDFVKVGFTGTRPANAMSANGKLLLSLRKTPSRGERAWTYSNYNANSGLLGRVDQDGTSYYRGVGFKRVRWPNGDGIVVPHCYFVLCFAVVALVPLLPKHFSLRTLLIGMTVVAVGLGLAVMMLRGS